MNNSVLSTAIGVGDTITDLDLTTFTAYPSTGKLPLSGIYCGPLVTSAPTPVCNANPLPVGIQGAVAVTGTFWQATQPVSAAALPLPTGAATAANQATEIASLASIDGKLIACNTGAIAGTVAVSNFPAGFLAAQSGVWTVGVSGSVAVTGTFWQATQPVSGIVTANAGSGTFAVSAASLPLPSGAATAANQATEIASLASIDGKTPTLGQALAAASVPVVLTAAQLTTLTPLATVAVTGTFWQATQPISGTVTANAGTNLNTSLLALEAGGNLATIAAKDFATQTTLAALNAKVTACNTGAVVLAAGAAVIGHVIVDAGTAEIGNVKNSGTFAVQATLAAETTKVIGTINMAAGQTIGLAAGAQVIGHVIVDSGTVGATQSGTWNIGTVTTVTTVSTLTSLTQFNGNAIDTNSGAKSAGTLRVVIATDQPALTNKLLVTADPITFASAQAVTQSGTWTVQPGNTANTTPWLSNRQDPAATTGTISAADVATSSTANSNNQTVITGNPTANSSVSATLSAHSGVTIELTGTTITTVTLALERSIDGGTTYVPFSMELVSVGTTASSYTIADNKALVLRGNAGELTSVRVRCTAITGTSVAVKIQPGFGVGQIIANQGTGQSVTNAWPVKVTDGTNTMPAGDTAARGIFHIPAVATTGGSTPFKLISAASTNGTNVKASAGQIYEIICSNINAAVRYLKLYDKATTPTVGTDVPVWTLAIPGNTAGAGLAKTIPDGLTFTSGIGIGLTTGSADNDTGAVGASDLIVNLGYK